jgi:hypothetical protein
LGQANSEIDMTRANSPSRLGSEFNDFLFAPIGEERNGNQLSVVSALARLDLDPWHEAAGLARLHQEAATRRLAGLISALPDVPSAHPDSGSIAARLIALLPRQDFFSKSASDAAPRGEPLMGNRRVVIYMIFLAMMLCSQWFFASHRPPATADDVQTPVASSIAPQPSPSSSYAND